MVEADIQLLDLVSYSDHRYILVLLKLSHERLSEVDDVGATVRVLRLQQIIVNEVWFVQILLKLIKL